MCRTPKYIIDHVKFWPPSPRGATKNLELNERFFLEQTLHVRLKYEQQLQILCEQWQTFKTECLYKNAFSPYPKGAASLKLGGHESSQK